MTTDPKLPVESGPVPAHSSPVQESITGLLDPKAVVAPSARSGLQLWLHRTSVFLFVLISAVAGVLLVILPWTPEWTDNSLLISYPWLHARGLKRIFSRPVQRPGFARHLDRLLGSPALSRSSIIQEFCGPSLTLPRIEKRMNAGFQN